MELVKEISFVHLEIRKEGELKFSQEELSEAACAARWMRGFLGEPDRRYLAVCCVDSSIRPVCVQTAAIGTSRYCSCEMSGIFRVALLTHAAGILLFHNHLSGDAGPDQEDMERNWKIREAGWKLGIPLRDYILLGAGDAYFSFAEKGIL